MIVSFFKKIDRFFCAYLGIKEQEIKLNTVERRGSRVSVTLTESYKRHLYKSTWESFYQNEFRKTNENERNKLGIAAGKVMAEDLIISFHNIKVNLSTNEYRNS